MRAAHSPTNRFNIAPDPGGARQRLLDAALRLFGERGFGETSIRDLTDAANVNLAAVNYYFGNKENLHIEALHYGFAPVIAMAAQTAVFYDEARAQATTAAAEQALRRFVHLFLAQILAEEHRHWTILLREQLTPGPAFDMVMRDYLEPLGSSLFGIVTLLAPDVSRNVAGLCVRSIIGQCVHLRFAPGIVRYFNRKDPNSPATPNAFLEESANHIAEFSIQAVRGIQSSSNAHHDKKSLVADRLNKKARKKQQKGKGK